VASLTVAAIPAAISSLYISLHSLLPESLQLYIAQVAAHLPSTSYLPANSTASHTLKYFEKLSLTSPEVFTTAILTVILGIVSMSSWRSRFGGWSSRYSPAPAPSGPPPRVSDNDFTYLTADDIVEPPRRTYDPYKPSFPRHSNVTRPHDPNLGPDIICLKHRGVTYPLHFRAFSIGDGDLTVGDLREEAARQTDTDDQRRIKLLYKGRILKDDSKPCNAEGLKQQSELLCVISEAVPTKTSMDDDDSESGADSLNGPTVEVDGTISAPGKKKRNHRSNKKKGKRGGGSGSGSASPRNAENLAPPSDPASAGTSRPTTPAQPKTAIEKLAEIASTFHTKLVPQCIQYISNPPHDARTRDVEYKKLSETILAQVILKLDAVELGEDEADARQRRKNLVKETQAMLGRLDVVHGGGSS